MIVLSNGRSFDAAANKGRSGGSGGGLCTVPNSGCCAILDTTRVSINVAVTEVLSIFSGSDISIPDKVRRAVFEPLDQLRADGPPL